MADFFAIFKDVWNYFATKWIYIIYLIPVILIGTLIGVYARNKAVYKYKVRVYRLRENGALKEVMNTKGGYITRKNTLSFFRIKTGKWWQPFKKVDLNATPKPQWIDNDDRVYYVQTDIDSYVQLPFKVNMSGVVLESIEPDIKHGALLDMQKVRAVLNTESAWKKYAPFITLMFLGIILIIGLAILRNACSA